MAVSARTATPTCCKNVGLGAGSVPAYASVMWLEVSSFGCYLYYNLHKKALFFQALPDFSCAIGEALLEELTGLLQRNY
jgi:hypothetical protein